MSNELLYLKQNVQIEPLVDQWYAWSHLIPPATAARNITDRHLKIMDSYISAPQIHANAVKNPKMLGGPFIDYDATAQTAPDLLTHGMTVGSTHWFIDVYPDVTGPALGGARS